ncbi:MAG: hypothetical protein IPP72_00005, partial [Chitinophagaceae bacterium]|nr:hypothetical protein [Chitinophagaceae bacterium]
FYSGIYAQTVKLSATYGTGDDMLNQVLNFENIKVETVRLSGSPLTGKYYQLFIKEYKNGLLTKTDTLFDGTEMENLKFQQIHYPSNSSPK